MIAFLESQRPKLVNQGEINDNETNIEILKGTDRIFKLHNLPNSQFFEKKIIYRYLNDVTIKYKVKKNVSFKQKYEKYFSVYGERKGEYDRINIVDCGAKSISISKFEEFAYIDHHADANEIVYGKQNGGAELNGGAVGRRILDIQKAYENNNVFFSNESDIKNIITPDTFNFTRKHNDYVWFLAAFIFDDNLQYLHLKNLEIKDNTKLNPRFFWNFTKQIGSKNTFRYLRKVNTIRKDEKNDTILLNESVFSDDFINDYIGLN
jgi:hypothetical protein